jgi:hypothetical protein
MTKFLITFYLIALSWSSQAFESYPIRSIRKTPFRQGVFTLSSYPQVDVKLDCASFLHGLQVKAPARNDFLMLYESECHYIYSTLTTWFDAGEKACLKIDFTGKDWDLLKKDDDCQ